MICLTSSSNPISNILSASSITRHCKFLYKKSGVFCKWSNNLPGVATNMLIPVKSVNLSTYTFNNYMILLASHPGPKQMIILFG